MPQILMTFGHDPIIERRIALGLGEALDDLVGHFEIVPCKGLTEAALKKTSGNDAALIWKASPSEIPHLACSEIPIISCSIEPELQVPHSVISDYKLIGEIGGTYYKERGYSESVFLGRKLPYAEKILEGYRKEFAGSVHVVWVQASQWHHGKEAQMLMERLEALPKPCAIFCDNDWQACYAIRLLTQNKWRVPRDCAVLGTGNNELAQLQSLYPISTVDPDWQGIGAAAGRVLYEQIDQQATEPTQIFYPPACVISRRSTEHFATDDPDVLKAVTLIESKACELLRVDDVVAVTGLNRRTLERRFQQVFQRGIDAEIRRQKIVESARLLRTSKMSIAEIAECCGFSSPYHFSNTFKKRHNVSPKEYRGARQ